MDQNVKKDKFQFLCAKHCSCFGERLQLNGHLAVWDIRTQSCFQLLVASFQLCISYWCTCIMLILPRNCSNVTRPFPILWVGSGDETNTVEDGRD